MLGSNSSCHQWGISLHYSFAILDDPQQPYSDQGKIRQILQTTQQLQPFTPPLIAQPPAPCRNNVLLLNYDVQVSTVLWLCSFFLLTFYCAALKDSFVLRKEREGHLWHSKEVYPETTHPSCVRTLPHFAPKWNRLIIFLTFSFLILLSRGHILNFLIITVLVHYLLKWKGLQILESICEWCPLPPFSDLQTFLSRLLTNR